MATTAEFRNGLCIQHNGEPWKIESFQHVKPGKGPAFVRTKLRNLNSGRLLENTFTAGVKIEIIRIENRKYQFLYSEGNNYHLMNNDDYEQIMLQKDFISNVEFLKEGNNIDVLFHADEGMPLSASLPLHVILEISHTYGRIVNIISTSVKAPIPGLGVSNTIRAAVANWAKTLSIELGAYGITVNNVLPGFTNTNRLKSLIDKKAKIQKKSKEEVASLMKSQVPAGRFGEAEEIANAVAFLSSPAASYINGINVPVDGGRTKSL